MAWFTKKNYATKEDLYSIHSSLSNSFNNVKNHTSNIFEWLNYFFHKSQEQENLIINQNIILEEINQKLSNPILSKQEIRNLVDEHYIIQDLINRIKNFDNQIENVMNSHQPMHDKISQLHSRVDKIESPQSPTFKEKLIKKITRNSKSYVKNLIFSTIQKYESISSLKLREIIVEEQGLCSKSSFYRMLTELEDSEDIDMARQGTEKIYISKIVKRS